MLWIGKGYEERLRVLFGDGKTSSSSDVVNDYKMVCL
jgi:hypothetical protein